MAKIPTNKERIRKEKGQEGGRGRDDGRRSSWDNKGMGRHCTGGGREWNRKRGRKKWM